MCCRICFWTDRVLAKIKCPTYFSRTHNELMVPSIKQHWSSAVCFSDQCSVFHLISQLAQNVMSSRCSLPGAQQDTPRDIFSKLCECVCVWVWVHVTECGWPCSHALQWGAAGISGSKALTGWPIPKPSVITGIKLFKATDFHFYSSQWKNAAPALLTYTKAAIIYHIAII